MEVQEGIVQEGEASAAQRVLNFDYVAAQFVAREHDLNRPASDDLENEGYLEDSHQLDVRQVLTAIAIWLERIKDELSFVVDFFLKDGKLKRRQHGFAKISTDYWQGRNYHLDQCWDWFKKFISQRPGLLENYKKEVDLIMTDAAVYKKLDKEVMKIIRGQFSQLEAFIGRYFQSAHLRPVTAAFVFKIMEVMGMTEDDPTVAHGVTYLRGESSGVFESDPLWQTELVIPLPLSALSGFANSPRQIFYETQGGMVDVELQAYVRRLCEEGIDSIHDSIGRKYDIVQAQLEADTKIVMAKDIKKEIDRVEKQFTSDCKLYLKLGRRIWESQLLITDLKEDLKWATISENSDKILTESIGAEQTKHLVTSVKAEATHFHAGDVAAAGRILLHVCTSFNLNPLVTMKKGAESSSAVQPECPGPSAGEDNVADSEQDADGNDSGQPASSSSGVGLPNELSNGDPADSAVDFGVNEKSTGPEQDNGSSQPAPGCEVAPPSVENEPRKRRLPSNKGKAKNSGSKKKKIAE